MKCDVCGSEYTEKRISQSYHRKGQTVVVDDIPALVCAQCGDVLLKESVVKEIQSLLEKEPSATAPLYKFPRKKVGIGVK